MTQRTPNVHISGPRCFKHHQNSTKGPQEREERKLWREKGKKARNFGLPTLRGPHPLWSQNSTSKNWPKSRLAEVEIGRSRNWPKSNWPNSKKKSWLKSKLAEVELAELEKKSWLKSKLAEVDRVLPFDPIARTFVANTRPTSDGDSLRVAIPTPHPRQDLVHRHECLVA